RYRHQLYSLWTSSRTSPALPEVMKKAFAAPHLQPTAVQVADLLGGANYAVDLLKVAASDSSPEEVRAAAVDTVARTRSAQYLLEYLKLSQTGPIALR